MLKITKFDEVPSAELPALVDMLKAGTAIAMREAKCHQGHAFPAVCKNVQLLRDRIEATCPVCGQDAFYLSAWRVITYEEE